jgi:hypothetical protein
MTPVVFGCFALSVLLFALGAAPVDVRAEMHRTAVGWAAWSPLRRRLLGAAGLWCAAVGLVVFFTVRFGGRPGGSFAIIVAALFGAIPILRGSLDLARPDGVLVCAEGVVIRGNWVLWRSVLVPWAEIEKNDWALASGGLRGMTTDPLPVKGQTMPDPGRVRLQRLDVAPQRVIEVICYFRDHPADQARLSGSAPMPTALTATAEARR